MREEFHTVRPRPWYRQFWPWFLMFGPFVVVLGCVYTIYLAITQNPDHELHMKARAQGLVVVRPKEDYNPQQMRFIPPHSSAVKKTTTQ